MAGLINYVKKVFKNYPDTTTPINAENLNHLDNGIYDLDQAVNTQVTQINASLTASDNLKFNFSKSGSQYGYLNSSGAFIPFKNPTGTLSITANGTYNVTDYASANVNVKNPSIFYKFSGPHSVAGYWTTTQVTISFSDVVSSITSIKEIRLVDKSSYISYTNLTFSGTTVSLTLKNAADAAFSATVFASINGIPK